MSPYCRQGRCGRISAARHRRHRHHRLVTTTVGVRHHSRERSDGLGRRGAGGMSAPGLLIAAPRSGSGKTTVTLGLMRALVRRGLRVRGAKCGPDYIDPAFHVAATGRPSVNLDSWAMSPDLLAMLLSEIGTDCDLVVAEALMGLFDGVENCPTGRCGSSADIAALAGWPVVLVAGCERPKSVGRSCRRGFCEIRSAHPHCWRCAEQSRQRTSHAFGDRRSGDGGACCFRRIAARGCAGITGAPPGAGPSRRDGEFGRAARCARGRDSRSP